MWTGHIVDNDTEALCVNITYSGMFVVVYKLRY